MKSYSITFSDQSIQTLQAESFDVRSGALVFFAGDGLPKEALAAGTWLRVAEITVQPPEPL